MKYINQLVFFLLIVIISACTATKAAWYNFSGIKDYKIFASRPLQKSSEPFYFKEYEQKPSKINKLNLDSLDDFLKETPTVAFMVIRNDSILFENYYHKYNQESIVASFSTAKSYVSALVGIAVGEGYIKDVQEPITNYITELKEKEGFDKITIEHLLQMTSGIKARERYYSPFSDAAKIYYGNNLRKYIAKRLKIDYSAGEKFKYISINTQLLGLIVERATKKYLTDYFQEKIWTPLGMEYDASWSIDRKKDGLEKAFCCLNMRARDYAKFGRLYLNKGNWNGKQIIPQEWVEKTTDVTDVSNGNVWYQQYQWWFTSKSGNFTTNGLHGQFVYVNPSKKLVIVRLGKSGGKNISWYKTFEHIASKL